MFGDSQSNRADINSDAPQLKGVRPAAALSHCQALPDWACLTAVRHGGMQPELYSKQETNSHTHPLLPACPRAGNSSEPIPCLTCPNCSLQRPHHCPFTLQAASSATTMALCCPPERWWATRLRRAHPVINSTKASPPAGDACCAARRLPCQAHRSCINSAHPGALLRSAKSLAAGRPWLRPEGPTLTPLTAARQSRRSL